MAFVSRREIGRWEFPFRAGLGEVRDIGCEAPPGRSGMRHLFLAAAMMIGALVITFLAASSLQGWATSRANYASAGVAPTVAPIANAPQPAFAGAPRTRIHSMSPGEASNPDQAAESKL